jgi:S-DNA-T family DNA segregation ATPase FtsK/SpoIIIE
MDKRKMKNNSLWLGAFRRFAPRWYKSWRVAQADEIKLQTMRANALLHIPADERARLGITFDGQTFRNHDSGAVYGGVGHIQHDPYLQRLDRIERMLIASGPGGANKTSELLQENTQVAQLPARVPLTGLIDAAPSFRDIVLGVALDANGNTQVVRSDMARLVHVAVGGSSGWGKSVFLRSLAYQLAKSIDPVDLVMIDLEGATLAPFAGCEKLLYPIADDEKPAAFVLRELTGELDRRKALFAEFPGVDSLAVYNALAVDKLAPVVCIIDEATALLENREIESQIRVLALRARKYGLWLVLAGQDWKANSLDTAIRNQLSTRIQFRAMSAGQSRVLLQRSDAESISVAGRAFGWLPGRDLVEFQAPMIGYADILSAMSGDGPQREIADELSESERIVEMHEQGHSRRQIALAIYGYTNAKIYSKIDNATVAQNATEAHG